MSSAENVLWLASSSMNFGCAIQPIDARIHIREQVEVLALLGDITMSDKGPKVHGHVVVGKIDGTAHGGHLIEAHVMPTLEAILTESPKHLQRTLDLETGLPLINLEK